ncbi:MAG: hypothetical protein HY720_08685 [Planctomycetes bacterium]|nr:hypothetical protein [Planctomycetota bacterium]
MAERSSARLVRRSRLSMIEIAQVYRSSTSTSMGASFQTRETRIISGTVGNFSRSGV